MLCAWVPESYGGPGGDILFDLVVTEELGRVGATGLHLDRRLGAVEAAAGKLWHSELLGRVTDACLQLHGGYGYMADYPVARAYLDARVERIYAGTSEIMKEVVGRSLDEPT
jgi:alkylation response protein AidB-like acyl-CoA dehydrogenase